MENDSKTVNDYKLISLIILPLSYYLVYYSTNFEFLICVIGSQVVYELIYISLLLKESNETQTICKCSNNS